MDQRFACVIPENELQPICVPTRNFKPWTPQTANKEDERTLIGTESLRYRTQQKKQVSCTVTLGDLKGTVKQGTIMNTRPVGVLLWE